MVVTLVDQDLNTNTGSKQTTFELNSDASGNTAIKYNNEIGLGTPSGSSTFNAQRTSSPYMNGGTGKILYASTLNNILSTSVNQGSGGNTIDLRLVETGDNSGTFKGSFQLSNSIASGNATNTSSGILKVSNGDTVYVYYDDSPSATAYDNSSSYQSVGPITILTQLGSLNLSKDTAYLSGDTVVATVVDVDRNSLSSTQDQLTSALKITGATYSLNPDVFPILVETAVNSSTFVATFKTRTGTSSDDTVTPRLARAIQGWYYQCNLH